MSKRNCSIPGCRKTGKVTRGWCLMHYTRWVRHGDPLTTAVGARSADERFWSKVDRSVRPPTVFVLHSCDNPPCVNPAHLREGTQADNMRDKVTRDRQFRPRGEGNGQAKLSAADVLVIRHRATHGESFVAIAGDFPVGASAVRLIAQGKRWAHLRSGDSG